MIDKVIHQIWIGHYPIPKREIELSNEIREKHQDYEYHLWTDDNLPEIPIELKPMYDKMYSQLDYVYCADLVRWLCVYQYGGYYLDIDWQYIKNLNELGIDHRDGIVYGHWGEGWQHCDYTITNNIFGFKKHHPMVKYVIDNMPTDLQYGNAPYSPGWCGMIVKKYMGLTNDFCNEIWEYHRIMREHLDRENIEYGDYNRFQNENFKHFALYSWSHENKEKFKQGLIK
jgi:mannosyltransferase OCH1-like enzyme